MIRRVFQLIGPRQRPRWQIAGVFGLSAGLGLVEAALLAGFGYTQWFVLPLCIVAALIVPAILYPLWK